MLSNPDGYPTPEGDVWSCGILFYVMLTGKVPYDSQEKDHMIEVQMTRLNEDDLLSDKNLKNASPEARDLIRKILCTNPKKRITAKEVHIQKNKF
tara:strand:- start:112 stop:396 length:285 start_codon:yes stop_codon:yes gene_type:complete